ncbi:MAG: nitroreductase family protein [Clostridia bacterium]|nr:nitroreductase family protein [Clostridia bacterium]
MNITEAIKTRRTVRKFRQEAVPAEVLREMVDCARLAAYGANIQPLKFRLIYTPEETQKVFPLTKWAGYAPELGPTAEEAPPAYIAVLGDINIKKNNDFGADAGAAVTNMMLSAMDAGYATCWLGAINRPEIHKLLGLDDSLSVLYLLAVGKPCQESVICEMTDGDVKYFGSTDGTVNVPKRSLKEIIIEQ